MDNTPQPQKIYIVTAGCYSDYRIEAVFTDKALAEAYVDAMTSDEDVEIEEYEANSDKPDDSMKPYYVDIKGDLGIQCGISRHPNLKDTITYTPPSKYRPAYYTLNVSATCKEKAQAIALERYHAFLAVKDTHFPLIEQKIEYNDPEKKDKYYYSTAVYGYFDYKIHFCNFSVLLLDLYGIAQVAGFQLKDDEIKILDDAYELSRLSYPLYPKQINTIRAILDKFKSRNILFLVEGKDPYDYLTDEDGE